MAQPPGYQGTSLTQVDGAGAGFAVRRFDPFGNTRGPAPTAWVGQHGFLGATGATTAGTGLVHLGAREYDPVTGRFTQVDPVMDLTDPTQWNAYSYAQNSPVTLSDPDGNRPLGPGDEGCNNCRLKTTKTKSGKVKTSWSFGNEPYTATVGVHRVKAPSRAVYAKALYKAKVAATKRTYFFGLIKSEAPMSTYDIASNCNAGAALTGDCSQGDVAEALVLTDYLCQDSAISCEVDGGGTSVGAVLAMGAASFGMGGGGRLGSNVGVGQGGAFPPNLSPEGAGRRGAFKQAKRDAGVPTSQSPSAVRPNTDKRGRSQPGRQYDFDVPGSGGGSRTITIRDDAGGHTYRDDPSQSRGPGVASYEGDLATNARLGKLATKGAWVLAPFGGALEAEQERRDVLQLGATDEQADDVANATFAAATATGLTAGAVGAGVGTFLFPGVGTVAGAAIGFGVGWAFSALAQSFYQPAIRNHYGVPNG